MKKQLLQGQTIEFFICFKKAGVQWRSPKCAFVPLSILLVNEHDPQIYSFSGKNIN